MAEIIHQKGNYQHPVTFDRLLKIYQYLLDTDNWLHEGPMVTFKRRERWEGAGNGALITMNIENTFLIL